MVAGHTDRVNSPPGENSDTDESHQLTRQIADWLTQQVFQAQLEDVVPDDLVREMPSEPKRFSDLRPPYQGRPPWLIRMILPELTGGRMTEKQLAAIGERPDALALTISGLNQATFETLIATYGSQFLAIEFFKCPRITDLSPLEDLPQLRLANFFWNQRAVRLWNLSRNPSLTGLAFEKFNKLHDLDDLRAGTSLQELKFGDGLSGPGMVVKSLDPITGLDNLLSLSFRAKIEDGRIEPLGHLTGLEELDFPTNLFTTRQLAWLRAKLPDSVKSRVLAPVELLKDPAEGSHGQPQDVLLIGKHKPFLNSAADEARIKKHIDQFWHMVDTFRHDPGLTP